MTLGHKPPFAPSGGGRWGCYRHQPSDGKPGGSPTRGLNPPLPPLDVTLAQGPTTVQPLSVKGAGQPGGIAAPASLPGAASAGARAFAAAPICGHHRGPQLVVMRSR